MACGSERQGCRDGRTDHSRRGAEAVGNSLFPQQVAEHQHGSQPPYQHGREAPRCNCHESPARPWSSRAGPGASDAGCRMRMVTDYHSRMRHLARSLAALLLSLASAAVLAGAPDERRVAAAERAFLDYLDAAGAVGYIASTPPAQSGTSAPESSTGSRARTSPRGGVSWRSDDVS